LKTKKYLLGRISLFVICTFYLIAGLNHFLNPKNYLDLIPPYFPNHHLLNILSGVCEIIAGTLMLISFYKNDRCMLDYHDIDCIYSCTYSFNSAKRMCFKTLVCSGMDCMDEVTITIHFNVVGMENLYMK